MANLKELKGENYGYDEGGTSYLPVIRLNEEDLPEAFSEWEVGGKYIIAVEVELVELEQENTYAKGDGGDRKSSLKVIKVGVDKEEKSYTEQVADAHKN